MFTAALLALAAAAQPSERAADEAALVHIKTIVWPAFYAEQDVAGLDGFLAPGFVTFAPDGAATTRADALASVTAAPWTPTDFTYTVERLDWHGPDLVEVSGFGRSLRETAEGEPCRHSYFSSNRLVRAPEAVHGWRALSSHVSGVGCEPAG
ncbi:MAG: DUF4440 domain-containing protein [Oceanicaulis sp.]